MGHDARITELLKHTARAYGGSAARGTTKTARARRAASYLGLFKPMAGRRFDVDAPSLRQMLQRGCDVEFAKLTDAEIDDAIQQIVNGRSLSGVLADLVVSSGAFETSGKPRRAVQALLAKWLAEQKEKK